MTAVGGAKEKPVTGYCPEAAVCLYRESAERLTEIT
jgi:hypothetical protein